MFGQAQAGEHSSVGTISNSGLGSACGGHADERRERSRWHGRSTRTDDRFTEIARHFPGATRTVGKLHSNAPCSCCQLTSATESAGGRRFQRRATAYPRTTAPRAMFVRHAQQHLLVVPSTALFIPFRRRRSHRAGTLRPAGSTAM